MYEKIEQKARHLHCVEPKISEGLLSFLHGQVSGRDLLKIKEHLLRCERCQVDLKLLRTLKRVLERDTAKAALSFLKRRT
jgi:hypothetical protein